MTTVEEATERVGQRIRGTHPYTYRTGEWGKVLGLARHPSGHFCYMVGFDDEDHDVWVINDPDEPYEFSGAGQDHD